MFFVRLLSIQHLLKALFEWTFTTRKLRYYAIDTLNSVVRDPAHNSLHCLKYATPLILLCTERGYFSGGEPLVLFFRKIFVKVLTTDALREPSIWKILLFRR
jgi:hypothetical protein